MRKLFEYPVIRRTDEFRCVTIPKLFADKAGIEPNSPIEFDYDPENNCLCIRPLETSKNAKETAKKEKLFKVKKLKENPKF